MITPQIIFIQSNIDFLQNVLKSLDVIENIKNYAGVTVHPNLDICIYSLNKISENDLY